MNETVAQLAADITNKNQRIWTAAPSEYDYGCTEEVSPNAAIYSSNVERYQNLRELIIKDGTRFNYQIERYLSSLYPTFTPVELAREIQSGYVKWNPEATLWYRSSLEFNEDIVENDEFNEYYLNKLPDESGSLSLGSYTQNDSIIILISTTNKEYFDDFVENLKRIGGEHFVAETST